MAHSYRPDANEGTFAERATAGNGIGGTVADEQIAFGDGTDITGSDNFYWEEANKELGIGGPNGFGHISWDNDATTFYVDGGSALLKLEGTGVKVGNGSKGAYPSAGDMRLQKNFTINALDNAGTGDLPVITMGAAATNTLAFGDPDLTDGAVSIGVGAGIDIAVGTADLYLDTSGTLQFFGGGLATFDGGIAAPSASLTSFLKLAPTADPPSPATEGMVYADTDHHLYFYNGTTWKQLDN